jgi:hypothetical protein
MRLRTVVTHLLAVLIFRQHLDEERAESKAQDERGKARAQRPERNVFENIEGVDRRVQRIK